MEQVRQSVNISRDLADQFWQVLQAIAEGASGKDDSELSQHRAQAERIYTGIWENLDAAAQMTRNAGRSIAAYEAIRFSPAVDPSVGVTGVKTELVDVKHSWNKVTYTFEGSANANTTGVQAARRAMTTLEDAWPELDWTRPAPMPDVDLRPKGLGGLIGRLLGRR
jgi:hypothetical protein